MCIRDSSLSFLLSLFLSLPPTPEAKHQQALVASLQQHSADLQKFYQDMLILIQAKSTDQDAYIAVVNQARTAYHAAIGDRARATTACWLEGETGWRRGTHSIWMRLRPQQAPHGETS
eukprot:2461316-Alexandrium_andersonii.AAC.1